MLIPLSMCMILYISFGMLLEVYFYVYQTNFVVITTK